MKTNIKIILLFTLILSKTIAYSQDTLYRGDTSINQWSYKNYPVPMYQEFYVDGKEIFVRHWYFDKKDSVSGFRQFPANYVKRTPYYKREYHSNGVIKIEGYHRFNKAEGQIKTYYRNGQTQCLCEYTKGKRNGPSLLFYENGQLESISTYENGYPNGRMEYYHSNGKPWFTLLYAENRLLDFSENLDSNGRVQPLGTINKKTMTGRLYFYDYDGSFLFKEYYRKGKKYFTRRTKKAKRRE